MQRESNGRHINLRDIWHIVYRRKWLLMIPLVLTVAAAYGGSHLLTEKFESRVSILVKESEVLGPEIQRITNVSGAGAIRNERDLGLWQQSVKSEILSPATLLRVIADLGLADDPALQAEVDDLVANYPQYSRKDLLNIRLIRKLQDENVKVGFAGQNLVAIMCNSEDPLQARRMAEILADIFREEQIREDLLKIRAMQEFTTEQLTIYKKEWEDAEEELGNFKKDYTRRNVGQEVGAGILDGLTSEKDQSGLMMEDAVDRRNFVASSLAESGVDTSLLIITEELVGYMSTLDGLIRQKASFLERYIRTDPKVLDVVGRLGRGLDSLQTFSERAAAQLGYATGTMAFTDVAKYLALSVRIDLAVQEQIILDRTLDKVKAKFTTWPDYEIELKRLEERALTKKDIYLKFTTQLLGSRINEDAFRKEAENRYKIIEPATLPLQPVYPDRIRITALGIALGLVLGVGAVLLAEILDNSLRSIDETESVLGLKVLGTIPRIESRKDTRSAVVPRQKENPKSKPVEIRR
ncbi:MAG: Wzz/FepE/Etk N-terminal domain-containing protein [Candidatus Zixiibacteriota bacterium]